MATLEKVIETSVTSGYQEDEWGTTRIALDGIQNHLPGDCGGTSVEVEFLVGDKWVPFSKKASIVPEKVKAIKFKDDGKGFTYDLLGVFHSTKKNNEVAVGQFGEGLKMLSAACLRGNIDLEIWSRNWYAVPFFKPLDLEGEKVNQLCYNVYNHLPDMGGSMDVFRNPPLDFVKFILGLDDKVLHLRSRDPAVFKSDVGSILDDGDSGRLFVKGIHISDELKSRLLFGYNLSADTNRDRNMVKEEVLLDQISSVLSKLDNPGLMRKIISAGVNADNYLEFEALYKTQHYSRCELSYENKELWRKVFEDLYGEKSVLAARCSPKRAEDCDKLAKIMGYRVVKLSRTLSGALNSLGIKDSDDLKSDNKSILLHDEQYNPDNISTNFVETSLTVDYRSKKWGELRIILDALANHMPEDSGGSQVDIEYYISPEFCSENRWVPWREVSPGTKIEAVRFKDDGRGYSSKFLELLFSSKKQNKTVGQFGEGLKMVCGAVLREKKENRSLDMKLRSRDWAAMPFSSDVEIDGNVTERLNFEVAEGLENAKGSATTIYHPTDGMLNIIDKIQKYVLHFNPDYNPLFKVDAGAVFDGFIYKDINSISTGTVFVKDFFITHDFSEKLLFSYNLNTENVSLDRDTADSKSLESAVQKIISECDDEFVVNKILANARNNEREKFEFKEIKFKDKDVPLAKLYNQSFHKLFDEPVGDKGIAVLYSNNPFNFAIAAHLGYKVIKMHDEVSKTLRNAGVLTDAEVINRNMEPEIVDKNDLNDSEKAILHRYVDIDDVLGVAHSKEPTIFSKLRTKDGMEMPYPGYFDCAKKQIFIKRDVLKTLADFVRVYTHEKGHEVTKSDDPEDDFRNFFEAPLTCYILGHITGDKSPLSNPALETQVYGLMNNTVIELKQENEMLKKELAEERVKEHPGLLSRIKNYISDKLRRK